MENTLIGGQLEFGSSTKTPFSSPFNPQILHTIDTKSRMHCLPYRDKLLYATQVTKKAIWMTF
jgi:hypothetical protein